MDEIYITPIVMAQSLLIVLLFAQMRKWRKSDLQAREFTRYLIQYQEQERKRIARELHDDFGQRLALVRMDFETTMQDDQFLNRGNAQARFHHILVGIDELSNDIQRLSHTLHSSRLQYLGLKSALKELCEQFVRQRHIAIDLQTEGFTKGVSKEVELCFYRIAQEALHNIAKHSGADRAILKLVLVNDGQMLLMSVSDNGCGFSPAETPQRLGIGLASMRERLSIVKGQLRIESTPGCGTVLTAHAPLISKFESHVSNVSL